ncbi:unnamed protein product [Prunus armeniaca]
MHLSLMRLHEWDGDVFSIDPCMRNHERILIQAIICLLPVVVILYELVLCLLLLKITGLFRSDWGNLTSLTHLRIKACENLVYLPVVEVLISIHFASASISGGLEIFGTSIHLKFKESLEVVYKKLMIQRIYSSDEGTLQLLINYLLVSVRIYSSDEYLPAVEGSENIPKTKRCTERRAAQVKWQRFSHISKSQVQGDTAINTHMLSNLFVQRVVHNAGFSFINESRLKKKLMHAMCLWSRTYCFGQNGSTCLLLWCSLMRKSVFHQLLREALLVENTFLASQALRPVSWKKDS